jgi:hypothetical protein
MLIGIVVHKEANFDESLLAIVISPILPDMILYLLLDFLSQNDSEGQEDSTGTRIPQTVFYNKLTPDQLICYLIQKYLYYLCIYIEKHLFLTRR